MYDKELIFQRYPQLAGCKEDMEKALSLLIDCVKNGGKLLLCG